MPILFSLGARLENLPLRDFLTNPTKISNALRQIRSVLKVDGLTCYYDPFLEAEALGCKREWKADGSCSLAIVPFSSSDDLCQKLNSPDSLVKGGRIPIACDVIRRLKLILKDAPALMASVTGPLTLATQLLGKTSSEQLPIAFIEFASETTASVTKAFLEAGADVVLIVEKFVPAASHETLECYGSLLAPIFNVIRFYEAMPVLLLLDLGSRVGSFLQLAGSWECVLCLTHSENQSAPGLARGIALPRTAFELNPFTDSQKVPALTGSKQPLLITSTEDLPGTLDVKILAEMIARLKTISASANSP